MDGPASLVEEAQAASATGVVPRACPVCASSRSFTPTLVTALYPAEPLRRCLQCGRRSTADRTRSLVLRDCADCGIPFLVEHGVPRGGQRCAACGDGRLPSDLPDRELTEATEREIVLGLERVWSFVRAPALSAYLDRLANEIRARAEGELRTSGVTLVEDVRCFTLGLPSGRVLMSLGMLSSLSDEAELAFVLAHELAHAASVDASSRFVRLGLRVVAQEQRESAERSWSDAALDVIRLGYGRPREREADRRAFWTIVGLGYDPRSAVAWLRRLDDLVERGDPRLADLALAHPLPHERIELLTTELARLPAARSALRVNREPFRRAAGDEAALARLERVSTVEPPVAESVEGSPAGTLRRVAWLVASLALAAALVVAAVAYWT